jgi:carbamoylphosphate synthase small subunit
LYKKYLIGIFPHLEQETDKYAGVFISNGPGDPKMCEATIKQLHWLLQVTPAIPIFGICLGHQLLSIAIGAKTYKLKFGNRFEN